MANPLFNNAPNNPYAQIIKQAEDLKKNIVNPKAEVERLLNSGQMTQAQFDTLVQITQQILPFFK